MFTSSSWINTHQQIFRFLVWPHLTVLWSFPQLRSAKSSRSGDRGTSCAHPLQHPQISGIPDLVVMLVQLAGGLENLPRWLCRIGLANAACNRRWLAIHGVSTWVNRLGAFTCPRSGDGESTRLHVERKKDQQGIQQRVN
jgi:hypothetical protein